MDVDPRFYGLHAFKTATEALAHLAQPEIDGASSTLPAPTPPAGLENSKPVEIAEQFATPVPAARTVQNDQQGLGSLVDTWLHKNAPPKQHTIDIDLHEQQTPPATIAEPKPAPPPATTIPEPMQSVHDGVAVEEKNSLQQPLLNAWSKENRKKHTEREALQFPTTDSARVAPPPLEVGELTAPTAVTTTRPNPDIFNKLELELAKEPAALSFSNSATIAVTETHIPSPPPDKQPQIAENSAAEPAVTKTYKTSNWHAPDPIAIDDRFAPLNLNMQKQQPGDGKKITVAATKKLGAAPITTPGSLAVDEKFTPFTIAMQKQNPRLQESFQQSPHSTSPWVAPNPIDVDINFAPLKIDENRPQPKREPATILVATDDAAQQNRLSTNSAEVDAIIAAIKAEGDRMASKQDAARLSALKQDATLLAVLDNIAKNLRESLSPGSLLDSVNSAISHLEANHEKLLQTELANLTDAQNRIVRDVLADSLLSQQEATTAASTQQLADETVTEQQYSYDTSSPWQEAASFPVSRLNISYDLQTDGDESFLDEPTQEFAEPTDHEATAVEYAPGYIEDDEWSYICVERLVPGVVRLLGDVVGGVVESSKAATLAMSQADVKHENNVRNKNG